MPKSITFLILAVFLILSGKPSHAQENTKAIYALIDNYSMARENRDTVLQRYDGKFRCQSGH
jgi:hypothetical protein